MAARIEAYVDTSALIAFVDRSDTHHALFKRLFADPPPIATSALVIAEGHGWFLKRYDRSRALQFLGLVEDMSPLAILPVGAAEQRAAAALLRKFSDQDLTLTDGVGLHLMKQHRVRQCWSTDFHLGLTGIPLAVDRN
ncbi:MAG: type II toxin-antitoxin system VapC family toxin [Betaproteobacteria bacterium]